MAYEHIFFDLDHTLWDFDRNSAETLHELFARFRLFELGLNENEFIFTYYKVNNEMWDLYHQGMISKTHLRTLRFERVFLALGVVPFLIPDALPEAYVKLCPTKTHLIPHAGEILEYLSHKYELHIITNGFADTQTVKLRASQIDHYFKNIFNSEKTKFKKPQKEIFEFAFHKIQCSYSCCLMIGDNLKTDIAGAKNAGIDQVYFNPGSIVHDYKITYEIKCLSELANIL